MKIIMFYLNLIRNIAIIPFLFIMICILAFFHALVWFFEPFDKCLFGNEEDENAKMENNRPAKN